MKQSSATPTAKKIGKYPSLNIIFSVYLALVVLGSFGLLFLGSNGLSKLVKNNVELNVFLDKKMSDNDRISLSRVLEKSPFVNSEVESPIEFVSKEQAASRYITDTGEDFTKFLGFNPLRDAFIVKVNESYHPMDSLASVKASLEDRSGIFEVTYVENIIDSINKNLRRLSIILLAVSGVLILAVLLLIRNTIKLSLYSQRFLIRSMLLVGATEGFVCRPFLRKSILYGMISGVGAGATILALAWMAIQHIPELDSVIPEQRMQLLVLSLVGVGMMICYFSTFLSIRKFMRSSLDELF
ncbi:cell division protein FtsX [Fulvitalea axinellae]|uniref:Cell division protein FtsX n=1 Tax=Fulvitalea axinellae TaxID=1182444 RepID=A0AAU9CME8_9BACT|nr:cell division protein FtsX [Fulvitalea axinellae]